MLTRDGHIFTDSSMIKEEELPKPTNLREEELVISHTNHVPAIVKPDSTYEVKNFGNLPLMNYHNSKLHTVSSYNVPHYTVTTTRQKSPVLQLSSSSSSLSASQKYPEIEYAPPDATGKEHSDAHLKAVKIWTHKSKGTAYTLHDDGTLSLELPLPKKQGH
ncbi:uncharacterized protein LOC113229554 isoform X2 [Hyposmocoma kahamanoa]|uniref:uncharacterized protein LOC113229554 isoform X2 n=1 Tax=Hyposmocoma kahamanoa TaxID=1477025 RepID=UPI000E6D87E0|nr:uncharacterized protein LOC113229554 isoform X2 [Hyposmocoma kahamanoa]